MFLISRESLSRLVLLAVPLFCLNAVGHAQLDGLVPFSVPGSCYGTIPSSIDAIGQVTGSSGNCNGTISGFLRKPDGRIVTIDFPGAGGGSAANASNPAGLVVGTAYLNIDQRNNWAFIYNGSGNYTTLTADEDAQQTIAFAINSSGQIIGNYEDLQDNWHGFFRDSDGTVNDLFCNGILALAGSINSAGQITGSYLAPNGVYYGFVGNAHGSCESFDVTGATYTSPSAINDSGDVAGSYLDANYQSHGFVRKRGRPIVTFDPPGSISTGVAGISNAGVIVGNFLPGTSESEGFVRDANGSIREIAPIGSDSMRFVAINQTGLVTGYSGTAFLFQVPSQASVDRSGVR
jgi:hypothetical protein